MAWRSGQQALCYCHAHRRFNEGFPLEILGLKPVWINADSNQEQLIFKRALSFWRYLAIFGVSLDSAWVELLTKECGQARKLRPRWFDAQPVARRAAPPAARLAARPVARPWSCLFDPPWRE